MHTLSVFRPAPARKVRDNLLWTAAQSVVVWTLALVLGPALIVWLERANGVSPFGFAGQGWLGAALFAASTMLNVVTGAVLAVRGRGTPLPLSCPRTLVVSGPYRYVRNPMAVAGLNQGVGVGVWLGSWGVLAYVAAGAVLWHAAIRPAEERDLAARFGQTYSDYRAAVPLWWPWTSRRPARRAAPPDGRR